MYLAGPDISGTSSGFLGALRPCVPLAIAMSSSAGSGLTGEMFLMALRDSFYENGTTNFTLGVACVG